MNEQQAKYVASQIEAGKKDATAISPSEAAFILRTVDDLSQVTRDELEERAAE